MKFTKMHGCGNDYIYIDCTEEFVENEEKAAIILSDRHFGIGGDGIILIKKGTKADFEMVMYNADGSRGAMCGNGIRCVAKYCYDHKLTDKTTFTIESMGAVKYIDVNVENGEVKSAKVDMGKPSLKASDIPVNVSSDKAIDEPIKILDREFKMTCVLWEILMPLCLLTSIQRILTLKNTAKPAREIRMFFLTELMPNSQK